jgi:uncharacterized protein involved in exopolysaccharide biosynthesis
MLQRNSDLPYVIPDEPAARPPAESWQYPTVDLREMGRILRRRYKMVTLPAATLLGLALTYLLLATTLYTATSTVLVDPRRANVVETNQSVLSNFGTDDATIESQTLLIQSVAILVRVVGKLKLTEDAEFTPKPGLLDPIKRLLFSSGGPSDGASAEDAARARSVEILQKRMKVTRQGTTFWSTSPSVQNRRRKPPPSPTRLRTRISRSRFAPNTMRRALPPPGSTARSTS